VWPGKGAATAVLFTDRKATELSAVQITMSSGNRLAPAVGNGVGAPEPMSPLAIRVHGEYREMPALRLTVRQTSRLFGMGPDAADAVLHELRWASVLACSLDRTAGTVQAQSRRGEAAARPGIEHAAHRAD